MCYRPILVLAFLLTSTIAFAQKNFQPGYLVLNNNDTLKGFIDYKEWYKNPTSILFATSKDAKAREYLKSETSFFEIISKEAFKRYKVNISLDPGGLNKVADKDTSYITDTVLLNILFAGKKASLFSYNDDIKTRYYLLLEGWVTPVELKNSSFMQDGQLVNEKEYTKQLLAAARNVLPGDAVVNAAISDARYSKKDLLDICYQLNGLGKNEQPGKTKISNFRPFAGIGLNRGLLQFGGQNIYTGNKATATYSPMVLVGTDLYFNPEVGRLFLRNLFSFSSYKSEASAVQKFFEETKNYQFNLTQTNIALQSQVSYNVYNQPSLKWFFGAGLGANLSSYPTNRQVLVRNGLSDTSTVTTDNVIFRARKFWLNFTAITGVTIGNVNVVLAYSPNSNISGSAAYALSNSALQLQVAYLFNNKRK